ncbi:cellulase family glycosylhydrolase [Methylobacterium sp. GC_Met_2]|uniref:cellulase family glycosylhydrolase n=1 Tax=Methylobacterium sp. GC_Met_2 TaxID=2937376 RepID=UPI00226B11A6|nr:cellulase family glycosylhydrolase [Methylobacterium sp. GC_Met_2]
MADPMVGVGITSGDSAAKNGVIDVNYTYGSNALIDYYTSLGMNTFRISFTAANLLRPGSGDIDSVMSLVKYAASKDASVVLDLHDYGYTSSGELIGSSPQSVADFASEWSQISSKFSGQSNVIFGLMNEPNVQTATEWLAGANAAIQAIRGNGATQMVLVPGSYWDGAWSWTVSDNASVVGKGVVDPAHNYAIDLHNYLDTDASGTSASVVPGSGIARIEAATDWARANGTKLFMSEYGFASDQSSLTEGKAMLDYMYANRDVWVGNTSFAGGQWWGDYMFSVAPTGLGTDNITNKPQLDAIVDSFHLGASASTIGTGSDQLVLKISQDAYQGDAQFTVTVDGHQIGGVQTAHALHGAAGYGVAGSSAQSDTLTVLGDFGAGPHAVSINFLNDAMWGTAATDRNLYIDNATYNGATVAGGNLALMAAGAQQFTVPGVSTGGSNASGTGTGTGAGGSAGASASTIGTGSDQLVLKISQDAYQGDAQFTVTVDGHQIGGVQTAHALHGAAGYGVAGSSAQSDTLTVLGDFGAGPHAVSINFLNDAMWGTAATDRNLYIDNATYNGATVAGGNLALMAAGAQQFTVPGVSTGGSSLNAPSLILMHDAGSTGTHVTSDGLISYTAAISGDTLHFKLDNGAFTTSVPVLATDGSADGQHTVSVYETSATGLTSASASLAFTLDTHQADGTTTVSPTASTGTVAVIPATGSSGPSPTSATGISTGTSGTVTGGVGTSTTAPAPTAPGLALTHETGTGSSHTTSDGLITYALAANGDTLHYQLDNGTVTTSAPVLATDGSVDGQHTVTVYETNAAGLSSVDTSLMFTLDTHHAASGVHVV